VDKNILLVHKGFKFRIYPNKEQESLLAQQAGNTRFVWNKLLESNIKTYKETEKFQFSYKMIMSLPKLKEEFEFLKISVAQSLQQVGRQLDLALKDNFKKTKGFPKFKKKGNRDSFTIPQRFSIHKKSVKLPKIGKVKWIKHRKIQGKPKFLTVSRDGDQWFCSVTCEVNIKDLQYSQSFENIVGIDVGLKTFASLSDETIVKNPRHLNKHTKKLVKEQRRLSRKQKGSNNRKKQIKKVQRVHRKIGNTRNDFLHKTTSDMIAKYSGVALEDLNIKGMMKNHKLARSISDVGWCTFMRMLEYKSSWHKKHFVKVDRWFASSKICNKCGNKKVELTLKDRIYVCEVCGNVVDRDYNGSTNIRDEGIRVLKTTQGHWESNACGDGKITEFSLEDSVAVCETRKRITIVNS
jgi:putative transposase